MLTHEVYIGRHIIIIIIMNIELMLLSSNYKAFDDGWLLKNKRMDRSYSMKQRGLHFPSLSFILCISFW